MEEELKCPICKQFYNNPVLLPCYHSLCLNCAMHIQVPGSQNCTVSNVSVRENIERDRDESSAASGAGSEPSSADYQEADKLSMLSETDSGVVCNSRPNSYVGTPNTNGILFPPVSTSALSITCPVCQKLVYFDENGAQNLPKYRAMQTIVDKFTEQKNLVLKCQLCEVDPAATATLMCEQCEVLYCDLCRESCHPLRGPLAKHTLVEPLRGRALLRSKTKSKDFQCFEHDEELLSMYCLVCKVPVCPLCLDLRHLSHEVQAINAICKAQKVSVKQLL
ncbi:hypothetical protein RUM43_009669 [Polyplax serrata]|uniref:E3 ubiquitin-protein ligase TRIM9 n=1 Tax=Polyplax serrata TaxID=468196 RepID=A0AAN8PJK6_POLSC